jgi:hypothetical protein
MTQSNEKKDLSIPVISAILLSVVVAVIVGVLAFGTSAAGDCAVNSDGIPTHLNRYDCFLRLAPNGMGDTLAGIMGALTLVWVVASVFQQSKELKRQREELKEMSDAMAAQTKLMDQQTDILLGEQVTKRREEDVAYVEELITRVSILTNHARHETGWAFTKENIKNFEEFKDGRETAMSPFGDGMLDSLLIKDNHAAQVRPQDLVIVSVGSSVAEFLRRHKKEPIQFVEWPSGAFVSRLNDVFQNIERTTMGLSQAQKARFDNLAIRDIAKDCKELANLPIWANIGQS